MSPNEPRPPSACWKQDGGQVVLEISGDWRRDGPAPVIEGEPPDKAPDRYDTEALDGFDSTLPAFLLAHLRGVSKADAADVPLDDLPPDLHGLMELALAVPEESEAGKKANAFMLDGSVRSMGLPELKAAGFTKAYDNSSVPPKPISL